jgi:predicted nucleotide-binding protein
MRKGVELLNRRIEEIRKFDPSSVRDQFHHPELDALSNRIGETLIRIFGPDTLDHDRYSSAKHFRTGGIGGWGDEGIPLSILQDELHQSVEKSIAVLQSAVEALEERLLDTTDEVTPNRAPEIREKSNSIFIVHGHDDGPKQAVARFLERLGLKPLILHEQPSQGRTVIEKFEAYADVGFAVVILTPDDECISNGKTIFRARQNVILELGFFAGKLGRPKVCALKKGNVELPSDYIGVVYTEFDPHDGWKQELAKELDAAKYNVDWNKVMRG